MAAVQTQPSTVNPSFKSLLSLPFRLCNPPPAVGKVRSFGVTPLFDVRLDDVLNRKHLPPLGLKDFEEWLLYVEMCPENLYFILWLREYRALYAAWQKQRNSPNDAAFASTTASRLSAFYYRAKQTFLTPNATYELNLTSSILAPFQDPDQDSHPHPSFFRLVEVETRRMLEQSLRRFIQAQMNNVGNRRALCGITAGILMMLIGFLPPIITNFVDNEPRWLRLTAFPGLWIGLTILIAALHGVCLGVYILGDLRQLRKFELARPVRSRTSSSTPRLHNAPQPATLPSLPMTAYSRSYCHRQNSPVNLVTSAMPVHSQTGQPFSTEPGYIEYNPIQGPSTCPILLEYCNPENDVKWLQQQELQKNHDCRLESEPQSPDSFTTTATFIAPFCCPSTTDISGYWDSEEILSMSAQWYRLQAMEDLEKLGCEAVRRQPLWDFDFDGLPPVPGKSTKTMSVRSGSSAPTWAQSRNDHNTNNEGSRLSWDDEKTSRWKWLLDFIDRVQTRCSFKKWGSPSGTDGSGPVFLGGIPPYLSKSPATGLQPHFKSKSTFTICTVATTDSDTTRRVKKRSRLVNAVPAFAVPLTRILSPIIVRGQWEVVIRSAGISFLITWIICGSLLAVPRR